MRGEWQKMNGPLFKFRWGDFAINVKMRLHWQKHTPQNTRETIKTAAGEICVPWQTPVAPSSPQHDFNFSARRLLTRLTRLLAKKPTGFEHVIRAHPAEKRLVSKPVLKTSGTAAQAVFSTGRL